MAEISPLIDRVPSLTSLIGPRIWKIFTRLKWWHIVAVFAIATLYWVAPLYHVVSQKEIEAIGGASLEAVKKDVSGKHGPMNNPDLDISVNPLVRGTIRLTIQWNDKGETYVSDLDLTEAPRVENIILLWGLCFGAIIALGSARSSQPSISITPAASIPAAAGNGAAQGKGLTTAEQTLSDDVAAAATRAADIYRRSTFLLAGGILMAFVGVSVFAVTLPTESFSDILSERFIGAEMQRLDYELAHYARYLPDSDSERRRENDSMQASVEELRRALQTVSQNQSHPNLFLLVVARALRPFGMLVFVEGIAWFLLRQYRSLIEDYKVFVRIQLKRSNYLIALKAASTIQVGSPVADVIRTMLDEDLTGRLSKDQTTESLETMKYRDEGAVLESLKELKDLVKLGSVEKVAFGKGKNE